MSKGRERRREGVNEEEGGRKTDGEVDKFIDRYTCVDRYIHEYNDR